MRLRRLKNFVGTNQVNRQYGNLNKNYPITGLNRPLGRQKVVAPRIYRESTYEGGKVVSPTHRPPLHPRKYS
jgi:hypothetical protein